jgi:hypothetical protein
MFRVDDVDEARDRQQWWDGWWGKKIQEGGITLGILIVFCLS